MDDFTNVLLALTWVIIVANWGLIWWNGRVQKRLNRSKDALIKALKHLDREVILNALLQAGVEPLHAERLATEIVLRVSETSMAAEFYANGIIAQEKEGK